MNCGKPLCQDHGYRLCPTAQGYQPRAMRLPASRHSAGSGSGSSNRARPRLSPHAPQRLRKSSAPTPTRPQQQPDLENEEVELPSLGWMWQVGSSAAQTSGAADSASAARPMPSAVTTVANLYGDRIKAKKSLGQNFLTDDSVLQDIVAAAGLTPGDLVLEIGPGTGNLTKHLLARGARVTAVEKDDTLYRRLQEEYHEVPELSLVHGDALTVGLEDVIRRMVEQDRPSAGPAAASSAEDGSEVASCPQPSTSASGNEEGRDMQKRAGKPLSSAAAAATAAAACKVKVVANLPYNITKDLLLLLLPLGDVISDLHIMIQHEAAVRLTERTPGGPEWRAANIRTLFYCLPRYRFRISRLKYDPVPGVDGALVTFSLLPPGSRLRVPSEHGFHSLVTKAFSERRKKMRNSVQPLYSSEQVEAALAACGLNVDARAQDLTLEKFVEVCWSLHKLQVKAGMRALGQGQPQSRVAGLLP